MLSESESKYLGVIDLSKCRDIGEWVLCLLRGRADRDGAAAEAVATLTQSIRDYLINLGGRYEAVSALTGKLKRFGFAYHTSAHTNGAEAAEAEAEARVKWFRSRLNLEAAVPYPPSTDNQTWLIEGIDQIRRSDDTYFDFDVSGQIIRPAGSDEYHLLWRESDRRDEQAAMSLFFTEKELEWSPYLVGTWIGRSSWARRCVPADGGGLHPAHRERRRGQRRWIGVKGAKRR